MDAEKEFADPPARLVWDLPVRLFHWALVALVATAWASAEAGWMEVHFYAGYAIATLLLFRIAWGLVGPRYARFASFLTGPRTVLAYLRGWLDGGAHEPAGHTPAGGWMIIVLLALLLLQVASGMLNSHDGLDAGPWYWAASADLRDIAEDTHETVFNILLAAAAVHIVAVLLYLVRPGINLVAAMFSGRKQTREPAIPGSRLPLALLLLAAAAAGVWYLVSSAPGPSLADLGLY
ncbi:cytochrome b/b6 domain-containing protein [Thioalkalivibrio sp. XN279]|uniref:cytochrome b/b6 domain-containing protein n=1 Tax=Thioalkalivibrio sp. XN279 TaxID=2714953 RepID=UPI00140E5A83|nr:cytochrome b/b6 domain-containing protein [Thioalkalivibrio sp. XN279]NHA14232.1 cytochrome B [Thioalkalivibrio sp. XN279]